MKVTIEDLRRHYDSLSDAALLEIDKADLTDLARACYEEECERRGLAGASSGSPDVAPPAADAAGASAPEPPKLVKVAEGLSFEEARYARELLAAAGIPSEIGNANPGSSFAYSVGDLFIHVPEALAEAAHEALDTELSEEELAAQAEAAGLELAEDAGNEPPREPGR